MLRRLRQIRCGAHIGADPVQKAQKITQVFRRTVVEFLRSAGQRPALPDGEALQQPPRHGGLQMDMELDFRHLPQKVCQLVQGMALAFLKSLL